jgi:replicative DNA helicase
MNDLKLPPQSIEAEMSVLGSVLIDGDCLKKVNGYIDGADFHREIHRKIFHAMLQCQITKSPIDLITLSAELKANDHLEEIGGTSYLAVLVDFVPMSANVIHYCKLVKESATRRKVLALAQNLISFGYGTDALDVGLKDAKDGLSSIMAGMDSFGGVNIGDITTAEMRAERYIRQVKTLEKNRFITGFARLDYLIRGVAPGEVMTIIAEPGGFKTAWLQNLLLRGAKRTGLQHLFFSLEMPTEKVFEREVQIANGVIGKEVERAYRAMNSDAQGFHVNIMREGSQGLLVCDNPRLDTAKIARYTELAGTKFGKINAIGIDYLGLMAAPGKTLFEKTQHLAPEFKHLAKELNLPVIILCQINREGAKEKHDILITDAKGGGDIEASADIMLGFYHDAHGVLVCKGLKNRNGPSGWKLEVKINKPAFQFLDMVEYEEEVEPIKTFKGAVNRGKKASGFTAELPE